MQASHRPRFALLLICLAMFSAFVCVFAIPPIIVTLTKEFHISYAKAGLFMTAYTMIPAFGSILIGYFADRAGVRATLLTGISLLAIGAYLSSFSRNFEEMLAYRILLGIAATSIFVPSLATVLYLLPPKNVNISTGAFFSALNFGLSVSLLLTPILAESHGWRWLLRVFALLPLAVATLLLFSTDRNSFRPSWTAPSSQSHSTKPSASHLPIVLVGAGNFLLFFQSFAMITWLPEYLKVELGLTAVQEGSVSMLLGLVVIPGSILAGWLADRTGAWCVALSGATLCAICPTLLISLPKLPATEVSSIVFFLSLGTSLLTIPITSVMSKLVSREHGGKAVGIILTTGYTGAIVASYGGGYLLTATGTCKWTFAACALSMVATMFLLFALRTTYRRFDRTDGFAVAAP